MKKSDQFTRWLEGNALGVRQLAGLGPLEQLIPRRFAAGLGYLIVTPDEIPGFDETMVKQLLVFDPRGWSGSSAMLPNGQRVVLLNPTHTVTRNNITIMEEIAHDYLGHMPSLGTKIGTVRQRDFSKSQERQAYALGAATALPARRLEFLVRTKKSVEEIAALENLSRSLVRYRLNVSGLAAVA